MNKVKPYPFFVSLLIEDQNKVIEGSILKMTPIGFIVKETTVDHLKVGHHLKASFKLPAEVSQHTVTCKVIKTYDQMIPNSDGTFGKELLAELHFSHPSDILTNEILRFIVKIGQK